MPIDLQKTPTFLEHARALVERKREDVFATWYNEEGVATDDYSFGRLWDEAGVVSYFLRVKWGLNKGDKVVLCYDFGLHFFSVLIGCLRAGVIPVLVYPPAPPLTKSLPKLASAVSICSPVLILTDSKVYALKTLDELNPLSKSRSLWPDSTELTFKVTDKLPFPHHQTKKSRLAALVPPRAKKQENYSFDEPTVGPDDVAFLQFTSGSTGRPKGIIVKHKNLISNAKVYCGGFERYGSVKGEGWIGCTWLPQYHDMGLLCATIYPFCGGWRQHCMSPITFIKNPLLWLQIMSDQKVNWGIAPDFSYRLCVRKFLEAKKAGIAEPIPNLDLSHMWRLQTAAEPIRIETIRQFHETFEPYGLPPSPKCLMGSYGIAEMVVAVCHSLECRISEPRDEDASQYVAIAWRSILDESITIKIVDPKTHQEVPDNTTGEIWIAGSSVSGGYYGQPELTRETFGASLRAADGSNLPESKAFLRTGDLGFFQHDNLYICGRSKDLIIVQGVNYYPQDCEDAVQDASDAVRPGCVAAFSTNETGGDGDLQIVFEIRKTREKDAAQVCNDVRQAILAKIGLVPSIIVAVAQGTISKTTSGKIQRRANRTRLNNGDHVIVHSLGTEQASTGTSNLPLVEGDEHDKQPEMFDSELFDAALVDVMGSNVNTAQTWDENGLTSIMMVEFSNRLSADFAIVIPSNFQDIYTTPNKLKEFVLKRQTNLFPVQLPQLPHPSSWDRKMSWSVATFLQGMGAMAILLLFVTSLIPAYCFVTTSFTSNNPILFPVMVPIWYLSLTLVLVAAKWVVVGRYASKETAVPSVAYVQWWFLDRLVHVWEFWVGTFIRGTPLITVVYKLMGASIDWSASVDCFIREFDLVSIGAESSCEKQLQCRKFGAWDESGLSLRFRPVSVGANCTVAGHLEPGVSLGDGAFVENLSSLTEGSQVPSFAIAAGSPACQQAEPAAANHNQSWRLIGCCKVALLFVQLYLSAGLFLLATLSTPSELLQGFRYGWLVRLFLALAVYVVYSLGTTIVLKWILIGKRRPGPVSSSHRQEVMDWFADYNYRVSILVFESLAANSCLVNVLLMMMGLDVDLNSKVWAFLFSPSMIDLVTVRNSFLSFERFRIRPGNGKENRSIRIENSSIGHSSFIEGGAQIQSEVIRPLSFVPSDYESSASSSSSSPSNRVLEPTKEECNEVRSTSRFQGAFTTLKKAWCDVFVVLYACLLFLAFLPTVELWKGLEAVDGLSSSAVGSFVIKVACSILVQTVSLWTALGLGLLLFGPRPGQQCLSLTQNTWQLGAYGATLSFHYSCEAWSFSHLLWGTMLYNPLLRLFGAQVGQDVLYFGNALYDYNFLSFGDRTVVDGAALICGHSGLNEGISFGETHVSGVLHPGVIALAGTHHHQDDADNEVGPMCFMAPSASVSASTACSTSDGRKGYHSAAVPLGSSDTPDATGESLEPDTRNSDFDLENLLEDVELGV